MILGGKDVSNLDYFEFQPSKEGLEQRKNARRFSKVK